MYQCWNFECLPHTHTHTHVHTHTHTYTHTPHTHVHTHTYTRTHTHTHTVDPNGDVCISILHEPGEDKWGYERPEERWLPIHTVETIIISVISMLADPNDESPANVDAAVSVGLSSVRVGLWR